MIGNFIRRENEIFDVLNRLKNEKIDFVLIGGYAVSAFKHRFSIDADIVIKENELAKTADVLKGLKFVPYKSTNLENSYKGSFKAFIKKTDLPVTVDLLINAVSCRQTDASWSFDLFRRNSIEMEIKGIEKSIVCRIAAKEMLIATKIHSSRLTDIRDVTAICSDSDIDKIIQFAKRGNFVKLNECLRSFKQTLNNKNFIDSFKGVFSLERFPVDSFSFSKKIIVRLENELKI